MFLFGLASLHSLRDTSHPNTPEIGFHQDPCISPWENNEIYKIKNKALSCKVKESEKMYGSILFLKMQKCL